ncbi:MAG: hypothetical protein Q8Q33_01055 [Chlamydiota bacterium]|nr:hypothetical protein [Chlamydiota bacterium]
MDPLEELPKSKSTIYMATPVKEGSLAECPHCKAQMTVSRKTSIIQCSECDNYMHIVFVKKP